MNNWILTLFNTRRGKNMLKMFRKRGNNSGMMWSIIGLGVSMAAFFGLRRNRDSQGKPAVENIMENLPLGKNDQFSNLAAMATEFSKELAPNNNNDKN